MKVDFLPLGRAYAELESGIDAAMRRVARSGGYVLGEEVERFEREFADYCGSRHCVGVASGLDALRLALQALGVGSGDEVIVPSNTYIATWLAVTHCGARPVPVEPDPATCNIGPRGVASAVSPRTKAIVPVHLYGQPADLDALAEVARPRGIPILEDGAQAHGARYKGRRVGSHGNPVAWSFYPTKNLGAMGDAGAVTTDDASLAATLRMLRNYGSSRPAVNEVPGHNSRLDPLQAAILSVKLGSLEAWNGRRAAIAASYRDALRDLGLRLPDVPEWAQPAWHLFVVSSPRREELRRRLAAAGVETLVHYPTPPHAQPAYSHLRMAPGSLPVAGRLAAEVLSLPLHPHMEAAEARAVVGAVRDAMRLPAAAREP